MRWLKAKLLVLVVGITMVASPALAGTVGVFDGPLFGLSSGPHGGLLVADASAGIHFLRGGESKLVVELPGVTDVSLIRHRAMWATTTGENPEEDSGQAVYRIIRGEPHLVANLFEFEAAANPDGVEPFDTNPFDVQALGWNSALVVDAGGNDLLKVNKWGHVKVLAVFGDEIVSTDNIKALAGCPTPPPIPEVEELCFLPDEMPAQAVPTSVAIGPDGYYYVGELKGFPAPTGESNIWRVSPHARWAECPSKHCVKVFDGGFTSVIDLAFDRHGKLWVAEMDEASWAAVEIFGTGDGGTINKCSIRTLKCKEVATGIPMLTAIALGKHRSVWATQNSLIPGLAEVIRIK